MITKKWLFFVGVLALILGFNIGCHHKAVKNIWSYEDNGLVKLNEQIAKDKSRRLGLVLLTENGVYTLSSMTEHYKVFGGIFMKDKYIYGNILPEYIIEESKTP